MTTLKTEVILQSEELTRAEMALAFERAMRDAAGEGMAVRQGAFEVVEE